jgi:methylthioribose-1-phosphate isomerase
MALAITALRSKAKDKTQLLRELERAARRIKKTRPTAVNLFVGLNRALMAAKKEREIKNIKKAVVREAQRIVDEDIKVNRAIGKNGEKLLKDGSRVLTHCNAGALATVDYGTALGVIRAAAEAGKRVEVVVTETRPLLQGARLTAWELKRDGIPVKVVVDSAAGHLMAQRKIDAVIVGADRITSNGDAANKIGTYTLALLAKEHGVPFYIAAPTSTIDMSIKWGKEIPIEYRKQEEVILTGNVRSVPRGVEVLNPAFDVTPARLITSIITERGVVKPGDLKSLFTK